jgi:hypothetical protein
MISRIKMVAVTVGITMARIGGDMFYID